MRTRCFALGLLTFIWTLASAQTPAPEMTPRLKPADYPAVQSYFAGLNPCGGTAATIEVSGENSVDFSGSTPSFVGDPALAPFFSFEKQGSDPSKWKAIFDCGDHPLHLAAGAVLTVNPIVQGRGAASPGLELRSGCAVVIDGTLRVQANNEPSGELNVYAGGDLVVNGLVTNAIEGTWATTGSINLATKSGVLRVSASGFVAHIGTQQGGKQVNLLAFESGAHIEVRGRVESSFSNVPAPQINLAAFAGTILVDGTQLFDVDAQGNRITSGVHLFSLFTARPDRITMVAAGDITVLGYGAFPWSNQSSASFTLARRLRSDSPIVPVSVTLANAGVDQVSVQLSIPNGSGYLRAFYANLIDESLVGRLSATGAQLGSKQVFATNATQGLPNFWMAPPGNWDFALTLGQTGQNLTQVDFTLSAPGLVWQQLLAGQSDGFALGVILGDLTADGKAGDNLARVGMLSPLQNGKQVGAVAVKAKRGANPGGSIFVQSLNGRVRASDHAFDVVGGNGNGSAAISIEASGAVELSASDPQLNQWLGARHVVDSSGVNTAAAGTNRIRSYADGIYIGPYAALLAQGDPVGGNVLTACTGVFNDGQIIPADSDQSDDSGVCPEALVLVVSEPAEGAFLAQVPVLVRGQLMPPNAQITVDGAQPIREGNLWRSELALADGPHTIEVRADYLSQTAAVDRHIVIDTLAPLIQLTAPTDATLGQTLAFSWTVTDASPVTAEIRFANEVISLESNGAHSLTLPLDHPLAQVTIAVSAVDAAGNLAIPVQHVVTLHAPSGPSIEITEPAAGLLTNADAVLVSGTVSAGATVSVNGVNASVNGSLWQAQVVLDQEGQLVLLAQASLDGQTAQTQVTIERDITPPLVSLDTPANFVRGENHLVTVSATDSHQVVEVSLATDVQSYDPVAAATAQFTVAVPLTESLGSYQLVAEAEDAAGNRGRITRPVAIVDPGNLPEVVVSISNPEHRSLFGDPQTALTGSVTPAHASLSLAGQTITSDANGGFELPITLLRGVNTYIIKGEAPGFRAGSAKVDLYLDDLDPIVTLLSPQQDLRTNQTQVEIIGTASDQYDDEPSLSRDGAPVNLTGGRFRDLVSLQQGANTFVYTATDQLGHTGSASITIYYETGVVAVSLDHSGYIRPGEGFDVVARFEPAAEVARVEVYVNQTLEHTANNGVTFSGHFSQSGVGREIPLLAVATDRYGNRSEARATVVVGWPHFVHGKVLADATSYPLPGVAITVSTPLGQASLITDSEGKYQAYVYGYPVDVANGGNYAPIQRHMPGQMDSWRVPDLRLTELADLQPATNVTAGNNLLAFSGFPGSVRVTSLSAQAISELLPLGYAPLAAFNLDANETEGIITWRLVEAPALESGTVVVVLERQGRAWLVRSVGAPSTSYALSNAGTGDYLLAAIDSWKVEAPTQDLSVQRVADPVIPPNTLAQSLTQPARVSVYDDPQTRFTCAVQTAGELASGVRGRVTAREQHERYSETVRVPDFDLDFFAYSVGYGASSQPSVLGGSLDIRAREQVIPERTQRAEIEFTSRAGELEQASFPEDPIWNLGELTLDFSQSMSSPRAIFAQRQSANLPGVAQSAQVAGFSLEIGGTLDSTPLLTVSAPASASLILLRKRDGVEVWDYVDRLVRDGETWHNDTGISSLRSSGQFLLLALDYALCELRGNVRLDGHPQGGADLFVPQLAWHALSALDGSYRMALPQDPESRELNAHHAGLRREGRRDIAPTDGASQRINQDIDLSTRDFRLLFHEPFADQLHVDYLPSLTLEFNRPVSDDATLLAAHMHLTGPDGEIPLEIVAQPGRYVLSALPLQALSAQTRYTFSADTGLLSLDGDPLSEAKTFSFTTRIAAVTRQVDLSAFTLSWENEHMYLEAPAEAYVTGTELRVYNPDNGAGFGASLATGAYRAEVNAHPGDTIELRATDPAGNSYQHTIDLTEVAPNTFRIGSRPFVLRINNDVVLRVDEILDGFGSELLIREAPAATIATTASEVAALENAPTLLPVQGIEFKVVSGTLPTFKARLQYEGDLNAFNDRALMTMSFQPGVMAPLNPERPQELSANTLMRMFEAVNIADGAPASVDKVASKSSDKFSLGGLMTSINISSMTGLAAGNLVGQAVFLAIMVSGAALSPSEHPVSDYVECSRRQVELNPPIVVQPYESRPWHATLSSGYYPVPGVPVYEVFIPEGGSPSYRLLAVSDRGGRADCHHFYTGLHLRGVDPVTGQLSYAGYRTLDNVTNFTGFSLLTYANRALKFDPEAYLIELGAPPPPLLKTRWEVGTLVDGQFVADAARTLKLRDDRRVIAHNALQLRLTVQSSQALVSDPEPQLSLIGLSQPGNPEIDGHTVIWSFAPGVLAQGGLVEATVTLTSTLGTQNSVTDRFVVVGEGPATSIPGAPPFVLYTNPQDEATKVLVADAVTVSFSEPVHQINSNTVKLLEDASTPVSLSFYDERGERIIDNNGEAATLHLVPNQGLKFDKTYQIAVNGVVDREDLGLEEPFDARFKTLPFEEVDNLAVTYRSQVAGVRNLTLVLTEDWQQPYASLNLYDARNPQKPMRLLGTSRVRKGPDDAFMRMELFTPQDLRETSTGISAPADGSAAYDDLPSGTILVLTRQRFPNDVPHVEIHSYGGGSWTRLFGYDSLERGLIYDTAKMGRYLILAHKILGYWSYEPFVPAKVEVLDLKRMLDEYERVLAQGTRNGMLAFEADVQNFAVVAKYPLPGDVSSVSSFARKEIDGEFVALKPGFLASGYYHAAIYDFDLSIQPPFPSMAMPSSDPNFDGRLVVRTPYQHGPTGLRLDNGAISGFAYRDQVRGLREIDLVIFMERHSDGQIHFYEVPRTGGMSDQSIAPLKTLEFPEGIFAFAVEPSTGLLAVQSNGKFSILDIKTFLETASGQDQPGFAHPAFMFPAINQSNQILTFIEGNLYGHDSQSRQLTRTPVAPKTYRTVGFEYYDLNTWLNPPDDPSAPKPKMTDQVKYARSMIYYATDLPIADVATFVMEQGSYAIELSDGGDIHVDLEDGQGAVLASHDRENLTGHSTQVFSLKDLRDYYKDTSHQIELRTSGFKSFKIKYRVSKNGVPESEDSLSLLVAYKVPESRYFDKFRTIDKLDLLALSPSLATTDFELSHVNPALDLSPTRAYHVDYAFQGSTYGVGMLSTQMLHLAMPTWWRIASLGNSIHNGDQVFQRVVLEQPSQALTTFELKADGLEGKGLDAPVDKFSVSADSWYWRNGPSRTTWSLKAKDPLPLYKRVFEDINAGEDQVDELRFPVFRFTAANADAPPSLLGVVPTTHHIDRAWSNWINLKNEQNKPSSAPTVISEFVNDSGGQRESLLEYENGPMGRRVVRNQLPGGVELRYTYDPDGYLLTVTRNGQRPRTYTWEELGVEVGQLKLKRLVSVKKGSGGDVNAVSFGYDSANLKVSRVTTAFAEKNLITSPESNGLPKFTIIPGDEPEMNRGAAFSTVSGKTLSSQEHCGVMNFSLTWAKKSTAVGESWEFKGHQHLSQSFEYDDQGRLTRFTQNGASETFTYGNSADGFEDVPTSYIDGANNQFSLETSRSGASITSNGVKKSWTFSGSGVPIAFEDPLGLSNSASSSAFYSPIGQGFQQTAGRPARIPLTAGSSYAASTFTYNPLGDLVENVRMGQKTTFGNMDGLGRPRLISRMGGAVNMQMSYTIANGLYVRRGVDAGSGVVIEESFNELGMLMRYREAKGDDSVAANYAYDSLGRLLSIKNDAGVVLHQASYDDETSQPALIHSGTESWTFAKTPGYRPRVTSVVHQVDGKSRNMTYATNGLGQIIATEEPGLGAVRLNYDGFGRVISKEQVSGSGAIQINYSNGRISVQDNIRNLDTSLVFNDNSGLQYSYRQTGEGFDPIQRNISTAIEGNPGGKGFVLRSRQTGGAVQSSRLFTSAGQDLGGRIGEEVFEADPSNLDRWGMPQTYTGAWNYQLVRDELGRVVSMDTVTGHPLTTHYDSMGRPSSGVEHRGKAWSLNYNGSSLDVAKVEMEGVNRDGTAKISLIQRPSASTLQRRDWLGGSSSTETLSLDSQYRFSKGTQSALVTVDPASAQVQSVAHLDGRNEQYNWDLPLRLLKKSDQTGRSSEFKYDSLGRIIKIDKPGQAPISLQRDADGRIQTMSWGDNLYRFSYDGTHLTSVDGGFMRFNYQDYDAQGQAHQIQVGDLMSIGLDYYPGGEPSRIILRNAGQVPTIIENNEYGDITMLRSGLDEPLHFTYNEWGAPDTLGTGNKAAQKLMPTFGTLNLPGNVTATLDTSGRLERLETPGLAPRIFSYDGLGNILQESDDAGVRVNYEYLNGQIQVVTHEAAENRLALNETFSYDERGRQKTLASSLDGEQTMDYYADVDNPVYSHPLANRLESFRDANGVLQAYRYDSSGNLSEIAIENGPTFRYSFGASNLVEEVAVSGMSAQFSNYEKGRPGQMRWRLNNEDLIEFNVTQDDEGKLQRIEGGPYLLEMQWSVPVGEEPAQIERVQRRGPGFAETWAPRYTSNFLLDGVSITRVDGSDVADPDCADCNRHTIDEAYSSSATQMMGGLRRVLDGNTLLDLVNLPDVNAENRRISSQTIAGVGSVNYSYDSVGDVTGINYPWDINELLTYDASRQLRGIARDDMGAHQEEQYRFDHENRRIGNTGSGVFGNLVYIYQESRVIAIGVRRASGNIEWTHAIAHGPFGPVLLKDLTGAGHDYFIFTDHVGTPFAYRHVGTGATFYTPYTPWGELLAPHPGPGPAYARAGALTQAPFQLPPDAVFPFPPLGLSGHVYDHRSGLVYMHHRFYHPRLGHFLTPDFRKPDIYDASTFKEPYAYAAGNPVYYWDPNGLYRRNIHGYFVYLAAYAVGMPEDRAHQIAFFAWGPDATNSLNAIDIIKDQACNTKGTFLVSPALGIYCMATGRAGVTPGLPSVALTQSLHAIPEGEAQTMLHFRKDASQRLFTRKHPVIDYIENYSGQKLSEDRKFGLLTHYFQDTFSHTDLGFSDDDSDPERSSYKGLIGHLFNWTVPDTVSWRPKLFLTMAESYYDHIAAYARKSGLKPRIEREEFMKIATAITNLREEGHIVETYSPYGPSVVYVVDRDEDTVVEDYILKLLADRNEGKSGSDVFRTEKFLPDEGAYKTAADAIAGAPPEKTPPK